MLYVSYLRAWMDSRIDSDKGATMVEYALLVALIAIFLITAVGLLAGGISDVFGSASDELTAATPE